MHLEILIFIICTWVLAGLVPILAPQNKGDSTSAALLITSSIGIMLVAGAAINRSFLVTVHTQFCLAGIGPAFRFDWLCGWFLGVVAICTIAVALYAPSYMRHLRHEANARIFWVSLVILVAAMCGVITAANAITFVVCWEAMAVSSAMLVFTNHKERTTRTTGLIYLAATRISTLFVAGSFFWLHAITHSWDFTAWHVTGSLAMWPAILLVIGLVVKAGCWPFHLWLPAAHPAAPAPVSALMSGVMVKTAIYTLIRIFLVDHAIQSPVASYVLVIFGLITAFWGVIFTFLQRDLKRLLAYSTVENVGVITCAIGVSLIATQMGLAQIGMSLEIAALFGVLSHALFKSTLFLAAGAVDITADCHDIDKLGGLGRRMPHTMLCTLTAGASFCALPPLAGFATEWLLLHGCLQLALASHQPSLRMGALLLLGWLALVGALSMATCIRFIGVVFLGRARSLKAERARECGPTMRVGIAIPAVLSVAAGLLAPVITRFLAGLICPAHPTLFWTLPTGQLVILMFAGGGIMAMWLAYRDKGMPLLSVPAWACGGGISARMQTTGESFAQPLARLFGAIYRYDIEVRFDGSNARLFPDHIEVETHADATMESRVYIPLLRVIQRIGDLIAQLQAGSIHAYLVTMFATLLLLLAAAGYYR